MRPLLRPGTDDGKVFAEIFERFEYSQATYNAGGESGCTRNHIGFDVPDGAVVLDCGAHVGIFAMYALSRGARKVVCVEPNPDSAARLRTNLAPQIDAGTVTLVECAVVVSDEASVRMHKSDYRTHIIGAVDFGGRMEQERAGPEYFDAGTVQMQALLDEHTPTFVKMDIEGGEVAIMSCDELNWRGVTHLVAEYTKRSNKALTMQAVLDAHGFSTHSWMPSVFRVHQTDPGTGGFGPSPVTRAESTLDPPDSGGSSVDSGPAEIQTKNSPL